MNAELEYQMHLARRELARVERCLDEASVRGDWDEMPELRAEVAAARGRVEELESQEKIPDACSGILNTSATMGPREGSKP